MGFPESSSSIVVYSVSQGNENVTKNETKCCQLCGFPRVWVCFLWSCRLLVLVLVLFLSCLFYGLGFSQDSVLQIACSSHFMAIFLFQLIAKRSLVEFFCKCLILGLFYRNCLPVLVFNLPAVSLFCSSFQSNEFWACFLVKLPMLGLFFGEITYLGLVFWWNYLSWACFSI